MRRPRPKRRRVEAPKSLGRAGALCDTQPMRDRRRGSGVMVAGLWAVGLGLALPSTAAARREATFSYSLSRVWNAAVRLVRVELECPIAEKDKDNGYFFFEYAQQGKTFPGTIEVISLADEGGDQVRVIVQVPAMPSYVEGMILDRLAKKLEKEYGLPKIAPNQPKPEQKPKPEPEVSEEPTADRGKPKP